MGSSNFEVTDKLLGLIQQSQETQTIHVDDDEFVSRQVHLPPQAPTVATLTIHTLQGIVDYLKQDGKIDRVVPPAEANSGLAVQVFNEKRVDVIGGIFGRFRQREVFVRAECHDILTEGFSFDEYFDNEDFNIALRSRFIWSEDVDGILRITGNITEDDQGNWRDDGISQTVTVKSGIAKVEDVEVGRLYTLQPYRTFREIEQPTSDFLLRLQKGNPPQAALFETDGGKWKLTAIERIRTFLTENLPEGIPIIA